LADPPIVQDDSEQRIGDLSGDARFADAATHGASTVGG
jgi:hypothetical protein